MFPTAFPQGNIDDRTPKAADAAGLGYLYASTALGQQFGQVSGRVTLNGRGIFGAHVTAFNTATRDLVGSFSLDTQGTFVIGGLKPGLYVLRVEPLDDADLSSYFTSDTFVEINFRPTIFGSLVAVPAGGSSTKVEIKATPK